MTFKERSLTGSTWRKQWLADDEHNQLQKRRVISCRPADNLQKAASVLRFITVLDDRYYPSLPHILPAKKIDPARGFTTSCCVPSSEHVENHFWQGNATRESNCGFCQRLCNKNTCSRVSWEHLLQSVLVVTLYNKNSWDCKIHIS